MEWSVAIADEFEPEFISLPERVQDEILAQSLLLKQFGPSLGRPKVDTLNGSKHSNMKELRLVVSGRQWRLAFAFDPRRRAMLLVAGEKSGKNSRRFYRELLHKADERFQRHLDELTKMENSNG
ncbi:MAG: addiction module toxin RelE [Gammaproteobacteria bacterium]|nr:addiction module toxin RelE [Gammaproteobacteria bacterium]MYA37713.1 addiction module toxin RelE [Gammaproteobacteria bacterium]MYC60369.1 addiction module toxin RelE [Gammaproteobacteria bacterium]MYE29358.1 addiction module toxin RelE [Gammaproteobacteria bacterium]MYF00594.1 addiction module toxin RelE [Gammaproteobacteria bacterium]